jgi:replicative DNA helicase
MANAEQRFIYALLTANRNEQEHFATQHIPKGVFKLCEQEMDWVYRFRSKHGRYPSLTLFKQRFPSEALKKHPDTLAATLQPILDMAMFAQMRDLTGKVKEMVDNEQDMAQAMAFFKERARQLTTFSTDYVDLDYQYSMGALQRYKQRVKALVNGSSTYIDMPWKTMNKLFKFFEGGEEIIIVARTSIGKSWVTISWANYYAKKGIPTLFLSQEMINEVVENRFEAMRYKLPYDAFREGSLPPAVLARWRKDKIRAEKNKEHYPLIIAGSDNIEGTGMEAVAAKIDQYKPRVWFVDGAYLINTTKELHKNASPVERFSFISKRIKAIAKATRTTGFAIIQLNRNAEKRDGSTKGGIQDIYGADAWAQDADGVVSVEGKRGTNRRVLNIIKGRESAIGEFNVKYFLEPYPDFGEVGSVSSGPTTNNTPNSNPTFKGI